LGHGGGCLVHRDGGGWDLVLASSAIEFTHPMQLTQKEKQALAYVQAHAMQLQAQAYNHAQQWFDKQNPQSFVHSTVHSIESNELNELCTCAAVPGVIGHASFCPLGCQLGCPLGWDKDEKAE
jgi:hypothetical protein